MTSTHSTDSAVDTLDSLRARYLPSAYRLHHPIVVTRAEGAWLTDAEGDRYIDFAGGIGVQNIGHGHPAVAAAIRAQSEQLIHSGPVAIHEGYIRLVARLSELAPGDSPKQAILLNSGAEAVENAVKIARHATGRPVVVAFDRGFHGRTLLTSTLNGKVDPYKSQPGALAPEVHHVPYPYPYRPPVGVAPDQLVDFCLGMLESLTEFRVPANKIAAVIAEPLQGEGGYIVPPPGFLERVRAWCERIGALFILDEIQTGFGRTGRLFAAEHEGIEADIVTVGKSIAAGLPLAAVIAKSDVFDRVYPGDVGGTYGGNPLACAAALAVIDVFGTDAILDRAAAVGTQMRKSLEAIQAEHDVVGDVRGVGPMLALEFVESPETKEPAPILTNKVIEKARNRGLIVIRTGIYNNVIRVLPPLAIDEATLEDGLSRLADAVSDAERERAT